jgi:hypothetical protein
MGVSHMRKIVFTAVLCFILGIGITTSAGSVINAKLAGFKVYIDGHLYDGKDAPIVVNGKTYLPLAETGKALNVPVKWNGDKNRVEVGKEVYEDIGIKDVKLFLNDKEIPVPEGGYQFLVCIKNNELMINEVIASKVILSVSVRGGDKEILLAHQGQRITFLFDLMKYKIPGGTKDLKAQTFMYNNSYWMMQASAIETEITKIKFNLVGNELRVTREQ